MKHRIVENRRVKASELRANPANFRRHPEAQRKALRGSLESVGKIAPLIAYDDPEHGLTLIDGHARLEEDATEWDVAITDLSPDEARLAIALLDPIGAMAETDKDALATLLAGIETDNDAVLKHLDDLAKSNAIPRAAAEVDDDSSVVDKAEELQAKWQVQVGDLWRIGKHTLVCGDCTDAGVVKRALQGRHTALAFTSPPYSDLRTYEGGKDLSIAYLAGIFDTLAPALWIVNLGMKYVTHAVDPYWNEWIAEAQKRGLKLLSWNVWDRLNAGSMAQATRMFPTEHEWLFVFGKTPVDTNRFMPHAEGTPEKRKYDKTDEKGRRIKSIRQSDGTISDTTVKKYDGKKLGSVCRTSYSADRRVVEEAHPARFPVPLPALHIQAVTQPNDVVYDPFCGSGTTLVACQQEGRVGVGIELEPKYCAVILERLTGLGLKAEKQ